MITSNQNTPLKIDIEDSHIIYFDISARYKDNIPYFNWLEEILDHSDALEVVMSYLLSHNLSKFKPGKISTTKMKIDTMRD